MVQFGEVAPQDVRTYVDGCSAPTFVMPLSAAALALRNHAAPPRRFGAVVAAAAARLHRAMAQEPFMMGGTRRLCTDLPVVTRGRVFGKVGAEGFYGVFCPTAAFGLAVHVDDGSQTAAERMVVNLLRHLGMLTDEEAVALGSVADPIRRNHRGIEVGRYVFHPDPGGHSQ
jgi:L-asparaginase II